MRDARVREPMRPEPPPDHHDRERHQHGVQRDLAARTTSRVGTMGV
jgi:hypothetical protein